MEILFFIFHFESIVFLSTNKSKNGPWAKLHSRINFLHYFKPRLKTSIACIPRTVFELILWNKENMVKRSIQASVATTINHNKKNNHNFVWQWTWLAQNKKGDDAKAEVKKYIQTIQTATRAQATKFKQIEIQFVLLQQSNIHRFDAYGRTMSQPLYAANRFLFIDNNWA